MQDTDPDPERSDLEGTGPAPAGSDGDPAAEDGLTHLTRGDDGSRSARMVDVGGKPTTVREAVARARVVFGAGQLEAILAAAGPKGPIEEVARVAGILGAKRTSELIPMCHGLALDHVELTFERVAPDVLEVRCTARCQGATGVEMEAMTGASIAALTVYDMVKGVDKSIRVGGVELVEKRGGKSGHWRRADQAPGSRD